MLRLRSTQFELERVQSRLFRLKRVHDQGFGKGTLSEGTTTARFFQQLQGERSVVTSHMATVRNVARLYTARNGGHDPTSRVFREGRTPQERPQKTPSVEREQQHAKPPTAPTRREEERPRVKKKTPEEEIQGP